MKNTESFEEWSGGASPSELIELKDRAKKRMIIYLLLSLIPFVNIVTVGLAIFCYNNIKNSQKSSLFGAKYRNSLGIIYFLFLSTTLNSILNSIYN